MVSDRHVVLIGMMGSGKTTIGRALADRMHRPFLDTDHLVETRAGRSVREIFADDGEPAFRQLETDALAQAMAHVTHAVVAGAGGIVLSADNRSTLASNATVVWLRARPATLVSRIAPRTVRRGSHRPLIDEDPLGRITALIQERTALYEQVADYVIDVDDLNKTAVLDTLTEILS
jgi:shikimate kinase